jgi:hypothetical protein
MYISSKSNGTIYLVTNSLPLFGDYNYDRVVDAADYVVWRRSLGRAGYHLAADGDGNGVVNAIDYDVWRKHFGETSFGVAAATSAIPEPASGCLLLVAILLIVIRRYSVVV